MHGVSNEISNDVLLNVLQNAKPVWEIIKNLASKCKAKSVNNKDLRDYFKPKGPNALPRMREEDEDEKMRDESDSRETH